MHPGLHCRVLPEETQSGSISAAMMIIVGVICVAAGFVIMSLLVVAIDRMRKPPMGQDSHEIVKSFMESLLDTGSDQPKHRPEIVEDHQEMAFVVTGKISTHFCRSIAVNF